MFIKNLESSTGALRVMKSSVTMVCLCCIHASELLEQHCLKAELCHRFENLGNKNMLISERLGLLTTHVLSLHPHCDKEGKEALGAE